MLKENVMEIYFLKKMNCIFHEVGQETIRVNKYVVVN